MSDTKKPPNTPAQEFQAPAAGDGREREPAWQAANPAYKSAKLPSIDPTEDWGTGAAPPRRWVVPGWIPEGAVTMLNGDGGIGKSLLAQLLATTCAAKLPWLGLDTAADRAIIFSCEDDEDELRRRQEKINAALGITVSDLGGRLRLVDRAHHDNALMTFENFGAPGEATELYQQLHNLTQDHGARLVVVDSLHDVFPGEENSRVHARQFIRLLGALARDMDGATVLCAHPSLTGLSSGSGFSGSTAWNNACRSRLYLRRPDDTKDDDSATDLRVLRRMKANYARSGEDITVRWEDGSFVHVAEPTGAVKAIRDQKDDKIFLACLDAATAQKRPMSESKQATSYGPRQMAKMIESQKLGVARLEAAMQRLFNAKAIEVGSPFMKANRHPATGLMRSAPAQETMI